MSAGSLQFVATPIGNLGDMSERGLAALRSADILACEDTRHSLKLLNHFEISGAQLVALHQHNEEEVAERLLDWVKHGKNVVVITDAGTPGISDPGSRLARQAIDSGIEFDVIPGASAVLMALVMSGFDTSRFVFEGFLPQKKKDLTQRCNEIAHESRTTVLFESPHRVRETIEVLMQACGSERRVALARELTKIHQEVFRGNLADAHTDLERTEPRGEYAIVIEGATRTHNEVTDDTILAALDEWQNKGLSTKDAASEVSSALGVPKRRAYALATGNTWTSDN